jgi:uncharacterized protein (TIGR03083 family)
MLPLQPLLTAALFRPLLRELVDLLRSLSADDWNRPTVAGRWRVRDVAAHLLDGDLRKLAACRDDHLFAPDRPIESDRDVAQLVNGLNSSGVSYAARLSPRLLTDMLAVTGGWVADLVEAQDPHGQACFAVSWAGEPTSENWMDTGREYTERWHHQAQIRDAVGVPLLLEPHWLDPLMDISVRALPIAYAALDAPDGTTVSLIVRGTSSPGWTLERHAGRWRLLSGVPDGPHASLTLEADDAWRLFYNALPPGTAERLTEGRGDRRLVDPLLRARSVIL